MKSLRGFVLGRGAADNIRGINRANESGNVLFLILIAVALFAALSYAVTQSSRSGSGDASSETSMVNGAEITQYPAGVRTAIVRMIISNNITVDELYFDPTSAFSTTLTTTAQQQQAVFHPAGGGATDQNAPPNLMDAAGTNPGGIWYFNANFQIPDIGTSSSDNTGNDLIAWLPGIKQAVCQKIDDSLGLPAIPVATAPVDLTTIEKTQEAGSFDAWAETFPAAAGTTFDSALKGQPFACFANASGGPYIYYHTLIER